MPDKERFGRFLRALVGLLTVAWLLAALASPPDPFTFLLYLVPAWLAAAVVAAWLVYLGGYNALRASALYAPRAPTSTATAAFVAVAIVAKLALTAVANLVVGAATVDHAVGVALSGVAVVVAYVAAFLGGDAADPPDTRNA